MCVCGVCLYMCIFPQVNMVVGPSRTEISDTSGVWLARSRELSALHNVCFGSQYKALRFPVPNRGSGKEKQNQCVKLNTGS